MSTSLQTPTSSRIARPRVVSPEQYQSQKPAPISPPRKGASDIFSWTDAQLADSYKFYEEIGFGNWGSVWRCKRKKVAGQPMVAVKLVHRTDEQETPAKIKALWHEFKIIRSFRNCRHENISRFYDFIITPSYAIVVMDLYSRPLSINQTEANARPIMRQLLSGLEFLHLKGVTHNDIKPANILTDSEDRPRYIDFGFAVQYNLDSDRAFQSKAALGTPEFLSPERARGSLHDDRLSDIWALGVTFYELVVGRTPFERHAQEEFTTEAALEVYYHRTIVGTFQGEYDLSADFYSLVRQMVEPNIMKRFISCDAAMKHCFFEDLVKPPTTPSALKPYLREFTLNRNSLISSPAESARMTPPRVSSAGKKRSPQKGKGKKGGIYVYQDAAIAFDKADTPPATTSKSPLRSLASPPQTRFDSDDKENISPQKRATSSSRHLSPIKKATARLLTPTKSPLRSPGIAKSPAPSAATPNINADRSPLQTAQTVRQTAVPSSASKRIEPKRLFVETQTTAPSPSKPAKLVKSRPSPKLKKSSSALSISGLRSSLSKKLSSSNAKKSTATISDVASPVPSESDSVAFSQANSELARDLQNIVDAARSSMSTSRSESRPSFSSSHNDYTITPRKSQDTRRFVDEERIITPEEQRAFTQMMEDERARSSLSRNHQRTSSWTRQQRPPTRSSSVGSHTAPVKIRPSLAPSFVKGSITSDDDVQETLDDNSRAPSRAESQFDRQRARSRSIVSAASTVSSTPQIAITRNESSLSNYSTTSSEIQYARQLPDGTLASCWSPDSNSNWSHSEASSISHYGEEQTARVVKVSQPLRDPLESDEEGDVTVRYGQPRKSADMLRPSFESSYSLGVRQRVEPTSPYLARPSYEGTIASSINLAQFASTSQRGKSPKPSFLHLPNFSRSDLASPPPHKVKGKSVKSFVKRVFGKKETNAEGQV